MKKTIKQQLANLMPQQDVETIHGKFYMRFELGGEGNKDRLKRIEQATNRGIEIYKHLIGEEEVIIVIEEWESDWLDPDNRNKNYLHQVINQKMETIEGPFEQTYYAVDPYGNKVEKIADEKLDCKLIIGKVAISLAQVKSIIKGIACHEMGEEPSVPQDVYFFSINKQAGFRIYDDRGCDIWANSIETLKPIYKNLNAWILDYNRSEIDEMFKSSA